MKNNYLLLCLLTIAILGSYTAKAQKIDSFATYGYCTSVGDTPVVHYHVRSNNYTLPGLSTFIDFGDGNTMTDTFGFVWGNHKYASTGIYTIKAVLYSGTTPVDSVVRITRVYCNEAMLSLYDDANSNCNKESTERYLSYSRLVEIKENTIVVDTLHMHAHGFYKLKPSTSYSFKLLNTPVGVSGICPSGGQINFTTPPSVSKHIVDFGIQCGTTSQYDLSATVWGQFRPVSNSYIYISANNKEYCSSQSGIVTLNISSKYTYSSASLTPTNISGNTITWNLSATTLKNGYGILVTVTPATTLSLGDTVCNTINISPTSGDINTANNTEYRCNTIVASFDPNEKSVYPQGNFKQGDVFTYRIDFENLGNDTAFNVYILDTLSTHLNEKTIEILNTSHPMNYDLITAASRKILRFDFPDIKLADSSNKAYNKGFVEFKIATKTSGIPSGTILSNRAGIYFDINPVVMTNTAYRRLEPVNVIEVEHSEEILVYPNPANDILNINMADDYYQHARVVNSIGQELKETSVTKGNNTLNIKQLPAGIYQLLLKGEYGTKAIKFQKL
ncbi:MAG: T9SS type A sorting domain-containing protein [Flavipsychrobacter sp.]